MPPTYEHLCLSANGKRVVFEPITSHTATHFKDTPQLRNLIMGLLCSTNLEGDLVAKDIDMGKIIGNSDVVKIDQTDDVIYAMRKNRNDQGYVPFTKSRTSEPSSLISMYLTKIDSETYLLASAWIGSYELPKFPQMKDATSESIPYWTNHAFVWGSQEIIPGSVQRTCPW